MDANDKAAEARMQRWFTIACGLFMIVTGGFTAGFAAVQGHYVVAWVASIAALAGVLFCGIALFDGRSPFEET